MTVHQDMNFILEFSTRYLTSECSERVRYRVEHSKIKFISMHRHVIFCLLYIKHQWKRCNVLCNHNEGDLFTCGDNMLFSSVKIWSFCLEAHLKFHWCLYNKRFCFKVVVRSNATFCFADNGCSTNTIHLLFYLRK